MPSPLLYHSLSHATVLFPSFLHLLVSVLENADFKPNGWGHFGRFWVIVGLFGVIFGVFETFFDDSGLDFGILASGFEVLGAWVPELKKECENVCFLDPTLAKFVVFQNFQGKFYSVYWIKLSKKCVFIFFTCDAMKFQ